jgi:hypothetical protein
MVKKLTGALLTGLATLAALLVGAPAATADTTDSAYLNGLAVHGVVGFPPAGAIDEGRHICRTLDSGYATPMDVAVTLTQWFDTYNITLDQAAFWVGDAIGAYCPWHSQDASKPN